MGFFDTNSNTSASGGAGGTGGTAAGGSVGSVWSGAATANGGTVVFNPNMQWGQNTGTTTADNGLQQTSTARSDLTQQTSPTQTSSAKNDQRNTLDNGFGISAGVTVGDGSQASGGPVSAGGSGGAVPASTYYQSAPKQNTALLIGGAVAAMGALFFIIKKR